MTQGSCARCGNPLPADGSACACAQPNPEAGAGAWGGLDLGAKPARAASRPLNEGSGLLRQPSQPLAERGPSKPFGEGSGLLRDLGIPPSEVSKPREAAKPQREPGKREPSRPMREPSRPQRAPSGPLDLATDPDKSVARPMPEGGAGRKRGESAPLHPALRGSAPQARAARAAAKASGPRAVQSAPLDLDTGLTGFGNPFGADAAQDAGPQLELASQAAPAPSPLQAPLDLQPGAQPVEPANQNGTQQQQLARKIAQLSGYGAVPKKWLQTVPYAVRVARRKRVLGLQLAARTLHRKQLELVADNALAALGEALFALRNDPRLTPLLSQLRAAQTARQEIGSSVEAGKRVAQSRKREFEGLSQAIEQRQKQAAPIEQRTQQAAERVAAGRARIRALEERMRAIEVESKTLKASTDQRTLDQIVALDSERQAAWGDVQSLNVELLPLSEDHARLQSELSQHTDAINELQDQQSRLMDVAERDEQRKLVATGGARSAYRSALCSLAQAALRADLAGLAPAALAQLTSAQAPIGDARQNEQLMRAAISSYDPAAYKRGLQFVGGCIIASFVLFLILIAF